MMMIIMILLSMMMVMMMVTVVVKNISTTCPKFSWLLHSTVYNHSNFSQLLLSFSAVEQAWRLLRHYLLKFTETSGPIYHKAVATKLLSLGCLLPTWLVNDYKKRNPAELLRIYICFDLLEEAGDLSIEYVNAVLGIGKESFGLKVFSSK